MKNEKKIISVNALKEYNTKVKEAYVKPLETKVDEIMIELAEDRATFEGTYSNRVTADGRKIKDDSDIIVKKIVGNTVYTSEGFKSATFSGIESKNQDGTKVDTLAFPKTEVPLGTTIDFESKTITNTYAEYIFKETDSWLRNNVVKDGKFVEFYLNDSKNILKSDMNSTTKIVSDKFKCLSGSDLSNLTEAVPTFVSMGSSNLKFYYPITDEKPESEIINTFIRPFIAGTTLRYPTIPENTEWYKTEAFTIEQIEAGNSYKGYLKGTETVLNDGAEFGADNTLTQEYDISSINSRIDEIETDLKAMATRDWVTQYIKENFPTVIYVGAAEPTNETGNDGDLYMQVDSE